MYRECVAFKNKFKNIKKTITTFQKLYFNVKFEKPKKLLKKKKIQKSKGKLVSYFWLISYYI